MLKISNDMEEISREDRAIVAFTATWCNPCNQLKPHFAKAAVIDKSTSYYVVDIDEVDPSYIKKYNIMSVPQVFAMSKGEVDKKIMSRTAPAIIEEINAA